MVRQRIYAGFAASLAALLLGSVAAASATAEQKTEHGVNRAKLAKKAEAVVELRNGIEVLKISRCGPRKLKKGKLDFSRWICEWRAEGLYPGQVPYHCSGKARWKRKGNRWRVDGCENIMQPQAPLLDVPNPHPVFGFNDDWPNHLNTYSSGHGEVLEALDQTHSDIIRMNVSWGMVEPTQNGARQWAAFDALYSQAKSIGLRPLWVLLGAPCWAQPGSCGDPLLAPPPGEGKVQEFGEFAAAVAQRYPDAIGIEVWNEPNYPRFWGGKKPDPSLYSAMLRAAAEHIHDAAAGMPVISAGLSPHADSTDAATGFRDFLKRVYELGGAQHADAIGIHPYPSVGPTEDYIADVRVYLGKVQRVIRDAGDSASMWATEFGVSTTGPHAFSESGQAQAIAEVYEIMRRVERVDVAVLNGLIDNPAALEREAGFGILHSNLSRKPAFCTLNQTRGFGC